VSGRIVGEILEHAPTDLTTAELLTFVAVGEDARDSDRHARFSDLENLERRTRLKPGTIRNALSALVRRGLLNPQLERAYRGGHHQEYMIPKLEPHHRNTINGVSHD
jgi:hypothetical protein